MPGKLTPRILEPLVEKVRNKVVGWKFKLLSKGGRLILLRHVLLSMPIHILLVLNVLGVIIDRINSILANFLWGDSNNQKKMPWRSWSKVCMPLDEGGLGLRNFKEVKLSLHMKFSYRILTQHNLWIEFFCAKYHKDSHISLVNGKISDSRFWRSILTVIP